MTIFVSEKIAHGKDIRRWCRFLLNGKKKCTTKNVYEALPDACRYSRNVLVETRKVLRNLPARLLAKSRKITQ